jgi:ParB family transcriptional regulator, chromosome partitioning protein
MGLKRIHRDQIIANPDQPRKHFDEQALRELAGSIRVRGLKQPITVRPHD